MAFGAQVLEYDRGRATEVVRVLRCGDCPEGGQLEHVGVGDTGRNVPSDKPTGALVCRCCGRFAGWVA